MRSREEAKPLQQHGENVRVVLDGRGQLVDLPVGETSLAFSNVDPRSGSVLPSTALDRAVHLPELAPAQRGSTPANAV